MRISFDKGHGSDTGKWLYVTFGRAGLRQWWTDLDRGPGNATGPAPYKSQNCGHKGLKHCNSAYCGRSWCNAQSWFVLGWLFVLGHTLRVWCGPTYNRGTLRGWLTGLHALKCKRRSHPYSSSYSLITLR